MTREQSEALTSDMRDRLFAKIEHGDAKHRAWLREALHEFFQDEAKRLSKSANKE